MPGLPTDNPQNRSSSGEIHITKLAAARRQICAAIRMFFAREDELAIHTVASAAYGLLRDLKAERGRDEAGDYYLNMVFYAVRDYRRGKLPSYLADDPETMRWIREMAERMPFITATSDFKDIVAQASRGAAADFWNARNRIANFLKHADRDPQSHIALDDVDNLDLLMFALSAYVDLTNEFIFPEGYILWIYMNAVTGTKEGMREEWRKFAADLEKIDHDERLDVCAAMLREMRRD